MTRRLLLMIADGWNRLCCRLFGCELKSWHRERREFRCRRCHTVYTFFNLRD